jgi:hypothetical protein
VCNSEIWSFTVRFRLRQHSGEGLRTIPRDQVVRCSHQQLFRFVFALVLLAALALKWGIAAAWAEGPGVPAPEIFYAPIESLTQQIARTQADPRPQSTQGAYPVLDWLLYGGLGWGAACDFNLNLSSTNHISACGPRFVPSLVAEHSTGIQRTLLYGVGDIRWYPSVNQVQPVDTTAGIVHVWEIQRDLIFRVQAQGKLDQQYSGFSGSLLPTSALYLTTPLQYAQAYASSSIQKNFGSFFTAIGGSVTDTQYQNLRDNLGNTIDEHFQNGTVATLNGRVGYHLSPIIYTFIEPSVNNQHYVASLLDSDGYRVVGGRLRPHQPVQWRDLWRLRATAVRRPDGWYGFRSGVWRQALLVSNAFPGFYVQGRSGICHIGLEPKPRQSEPNNQSDDGAAPRFSYRQNYGDIQG